MVMAAAIPAGPPPAMRTSGCAWRFSCGVCGVSGDTVPALTNLRSTLSDHRRAALETELDLLDWAIETHFTRPEELALARMPDMQGLGGSSGARVAASG